MAAWRDGAWRDGAWRDGAWRGMTGSAPGTPPSGVRRARRIAVILRFRRAMTLAIAFIGSLANVR